MAKGRRRRRNRRPIRRAVPLTVGATLVVAFVVGALADIGPESGPYRQTVDRSYAALAAPLVSQSDQAASTLATVLQNGPQMERAGLQQELDALVASTTDTVSLADASVPPDPTGDLASRFHQVMAERAQAAESIRSAIDALLEMTPLPVVGAAATSDTRPPSSSLSGVPDMPSCETALIAAGAEIEAADQAYGSFRRAISRAPGSASVPPSRWLTDPTVVEASAIDAFVGALAGMPQLRPVDALAVVTYSLSPAPLPQVPSSAAGGSDGAATSATSAQPSGNGASSGTELLPPTGTVSVEATVGNVGNVGETAIVVTATLTQPGSSRHETATVRIAALAAGGSQVVDFTPFDVVSGKGYLLDVAITPPYTDGDTSRLATAPVDFQVAPAAPSAPA